MVVVSFAGSDGRPRDPVTRSPAGLYKKRKWLPFQEIDLDRSDNSAANVVQSGACPCRASSFISG
jgi:hypothetical protein